MTLAVLVVRRASIGPVVADLRIEDGRIVEVGRGLRRVPGEVELDARQGAVIPGLHDHHLHLRALVAADRSVRVGPPQVRDGAGFAAALSTAAAGSSPGDWIRAVGYHESVAGDLDRAGLDRVVGDRPVRVQHRSGALWVCNSAGLAALGLADQAAGPPPGLAGWAVGQAASGIECDDAGQPTGRLWRMDGWLADRLQSMGSAPDGPSGLGELSIAAAAAGVTGWTDATPGRSDGETRALAEAVATKMVRQRLHLMVASGIESGTVTEIERVAGVSAGPVKVLLDDTDLPLLDDLVGVIGHAHATGRPVAVHCVTRVQLVLTLAAFAEAGPIAGDRIEHGALIPNEVVPRLAQWGLTVVTQPNFVAERGDQYLADVSFADQKDLWRGRSLVDARVPVAAGTDAPFGAADPWSAIRAAVRRQTVSGQVLGAAEAVDWGVALGWWWGNPSAPSRIRRLEPGAVADLVVIGAPLIAALEGRDPIPVEATVIAGEIVFSR